jgi:hypothetical membrane protein
MSSLTFRRCGSHGIAATLGRQARWLASRVTWPAPPSSVVPAWVVVTAALSPVLLVGSWLVADALQPASYSPIRQTVSVVAGLAGTDRWVMTSALFVVGGFHLLTAAGLTAVRLRARVVLAIAGLASIGIAACPEPAAGSTPEHLAWTALGAVMITIWPAFVARRGFPRSAILSARGCIAATAVFLVLLAWLAIETQGGADLGLAERLGTAVQISWPLVVILALRRAARQAAAEELAVSELTSRESADIGTGGGSI